MSSPYDAGHGPALPSAGQPERPWRDLAHRPPGFRANRQAARMRSLGRYDLDWREHADGESEMADTLDGLVHPHGLDRWVHHHDPVPWRVIHSIPTGPDGQDIDHLVIGPPGAVVVETKNYAPTRHAEVTTTDLVVDGTPTAEVERALDRAALARERLGTAAAALVDRAGEAASGRDPSEDTVSALRTIAAGPPVAAVLAVVGTVLHGRGHPLGVAVATPNDVVQHLRFLPAATGAAVAHTLFELARRSTTWLPD